MKKIEILSGEPISEDVERKIHDIFAESECPNESLLHLSRDSSGMMSGTGLSTSYRVKSIQHLCYWNSTTSRSIDANNIAPKPKIRGLFLCVNLL